jgi:hypothetical protein
MATKQVPSPPRHLPGVSGLRAGNDVFSMIAQTGLAKELHIQVLR